MDNQHKQIVMFILGILIGIDAWAELFYGVYFWIIITIVLFITLNRKEAKIKSQKRGKTK